MRPRIQYTYYPQARSAIRFSRVETVNIAMAVGALTFAFALFFIQPLARDSRTLTADDFLIAFGSSFIAVLMAFLANDVAHKIVAAKYGLWAEFRANTRGLLIAIITALLGIVIAAPGMVMISGPLDNKRNGKIGVAGPLANLAVGAPALALYFALRNDPFSLGLFLAIMIALVSLTLGAFSMVPIHPLDGSKVWRWNKPIWVALTAVFVVLLVAFYFL